MLEKLKRKRIILTIACFVLLLILFRSHLNNKILNSNVDYLFDVNLISNALQQAKTREIDLEKQYQFTAVILFANRLTRVQQAVEIYLNSNLFKEIIIWNNNPQIRLTRNQISSNTNSSTLIYIINSSQNLKEQAKYYACAGAQTLACFFADDVWNVSGYLKTLIASFRSDPNVLHTATNEVTYYNNLLWTFMDSRIDLHAGFTWIGSGSVFLREHAKRHLQLLTMYLKFHEELFTVSDIFFPIWLNDIPTQTVVNLRFLPLIGNEPDLPSSTDDFSHARHTSSILAIRKLDHSLRLNNSKSDVAFPREQNRRFPYVVKSASLNDDFLFFTNILPVDIEHIPFDITRDADRATYRNIPSGLNYTHFASHNTLKAVDGDEKTCWHPIGTVKKSDFFAIDFLHIQNSITFALILGHSLQLQRSLDVRVSFDGVWWISYRSLRGILFHVNGLTNTNLHKLVVDSRQFPSELQSFRYIAFNATYSFAEAFQVCDIQILKNFQINTS